MAKCRYIYKGHVFENESKLDDFLNSGGLKLYSKYGDIVFENAEALGVAVSAAEAISLRAKAADAAYIKAKNTQSYFDEEGILVFDPPYKGVTSYLQGLRNKQGDLLTPEFIEFNYWWKRLEDWKDSAKGFSADEKKIFGPSVIMTDPVSESELQNYLDSCEKAMKKKQALPDTSNETLKLIKEIKEMWVMQGKLGTLVHDILRACFNPVKKNGPNKGKPRMSTPNYRTLIKNDKTRICPDLSDSVIESVFDYAEKLKADLESRFGKNLLYFPEFKVVSDVNDPAVSTKLMGIVDLMVIDDNGVAHILDYKLSPKDSFNSAKERTFWYQLGLYARMLKTQGISFGDSDQLVNIAPIRMVNFHKEGDLWVFDKVESRDSSLLLDITKNATLNEVARNIDEIVADTAPTSLTPLEVIEKTKKFMDSSFLEDVANMKQTTDEEIDEFIEKWGGVKQNPQSGKWYVESNYGKSFTGDSELEVHEQVRKFFLEDLPKKREDSAKSVKLSLIKGIREDSADIDWEEAKSLNKREGASVDYLRNTLGKYCHSGEYEVRDYPQLEKFNIIAIENVITGQINFVQVSVENLDRLCKQGDNNLITGNVRGDFEELRNPKSLALKAYRGNVLLMELMSVINCMPDITKNGKSIGELLVINPILAQGMSASNEELLYNFNQLANNIEGFENNIENVKFASRIELAAMRCKHILHYASQPDKSRYSVFSRFLNLNDDLQNAITNDDLSLAKELLEKLRVELEKNFSRDIAISKESYDESEHLARSLYNKVMIAIADINGIKFRQQTHDNSNSLESVNIFKNGVLSLMLDNPGNLDNDTLNTLTKMTRQAYQNVRENTSRVAVTIRKAVEKLKKAKGFGIAKEFTVGNQADLYKDMYDTSSGDLVLKNPWDSSSSLTNDEREFLKTILPIINEQRLDSSPAEIEQMRIHGDVEYYRVPLCKGDTSSQVSLFDSIFDALKYKLQRLKPSVWFEDMQRKIVGVFEDVEAKRENESRLFTMTNMFKGGENPTLRKEKIALNGIYYFETNLETLALKHTFAYSMEEEINKVMPIAKASMIHLLVLGLLHNKKYENATNYVSDYIHSKIKNEDIVDPKFKKANIFLSALKSGASKLALSFSPMLYAGQIIQGLWNDVKLVIQNHGDPNSAFTFSNFKSAFSEVYKDMFHYGNTPTKCKLLNEFFGVNDMDMNQYADKLKSDNVGIFNFWTLAFHGASRPDFYNRMTILVALMKHDGSWDAYSVKDGELVYDWKLDKRFSKFAADPKSNSSDPEYLKQKGLYIAIARQMELEGVKDKNGKLFKLDLKNPQPLPKAYTDLQMESYKNLSDNIYGYYSHEKKAMIHATVLGSLWMQMRTYWSGKKNLYLGKPGIALHGEYRQQKSKEGELLYQVEDSTGGLTVETESESQGKPRIPLMLWEGDWQEGALVTLAKITHGNPLKWWQNGLEIWNEEDEKLRHLYQANLKMMLFDFLMFAVVGSLLGAAMLDWDKLLQDEAKNTGAFGDATVATAAHVALKAVNYSFLDFNAFESIGGVFVNWNPMSLSYFGSRVTDMWQTAFGDKSFKSTLAGMCAFSGQMKPIINWALQD